MNVSYALLAHPGHNRVYFDQSQPLHQMELQAVAGGFARGAEWRALGGVPYLAFACGQPLTPEQRRALESLSFFYALFELRDGWLQPMEPVGGRYLSESMAALLKYSGKTNEQFTALMINLAASLCRTGSPRLSLLDPMSGKGTTLWEALSRGMDASGVEVNATWHQEACSYAVKFLENARLKHKVSRSSVPGEKGKRLADLFTVRFANTREAWEADDAHALTLASADTRHAARCFKKESFDILVADLPYGVQHAGKTAAGSKTSAQSDLAALLDASLPGWAAVMKPGAALVLSFNEHTLGRDEAAALCADHSLRPLYEPPYAGYSHRVDQGIQRDLVCAVKAVEGEE